MPFLLARLGPATGPGEREVIARKVREPQPVGPDLLALSVGDVVLLEGTSPPWARGSRVVLTRWPDRLPDVEAIWATRAGRRREVLGPLVPTRGHWVLDDRGVACEVGRGRTDGPVAVVLNYAGWRMGDFLNEPVDVEVCPTEAGMVWIVTPQAVPTPLADTPTPPRRMPPAAVAVDLSSWPGGGYSEGAVNSGSQPVVYSRYELPAATPFSKTLKFVDLDFTDGAVSFDVDDRRVVLVSDPAREVYNNLRDILDEELGGGVRAVGEVHPDGSATGEVRGLERLAQVFERAMFKQFVRQSVAAMTWLDAGDLASRRPGGRGDRDPADLLDIDAFGFGPRADAFRRLFAHRDHTERVSVLPARALVIPLPACDGGPRWYAWETVEDGRATYLFRPADVGTRDRMLTWTQAPGSKRRELLDDKELQAELGFVRSVAHHDEGDEQLGRWWARLCAAIGLARGV